MKLLCILLIAGAVVAALTVFFKADSTEGFDAPASADTKHDKSLSA